MHYWSKIVNFSTFTGTETLGSVLAGRNNNLNLLRLVFALMVLISHSFPLALGPGGKDFAESYLHTSLGTIGVFGFFFISGLLVTRSLLMRHDLAEFLRARSLRIFPGLAIVLVVALLLLGPLVTTFSFLPYILSWEALTYFPRNFLLVSQLDKLPGVFSSNPFGPAVNGSLWTLPYEFALYLVLGAAWASAGFIRTRKLTLIGVLCIGGAVLLFSKMYILPFIKVHYWGLPATNATTAIPFFILCFFSGSLAYLARNHIPLNLPVSVSALILGGLANYYFWLMPVFLMCLFYIILTMAYFRSEYLLYYNKIGDLSYGVYIYAFPIQQLCIWRFPTLSPTNLTFMVLPLTLICAALSWHFIEKPALTLKKKAPA